MVNMGVRLDCGLGKQFLEVNNDELYQLFQAFQSPSQSSKDVAVMLYAMPPLILQSVPPVSDVLLCVGCAGT